MFGKFVAWIKGIFARKDVQDALSKAGDELSEIAAEKIKDAADKVVDKVKNSESK